jgi:hypothetical protein
MCCDSHLPYCRALRASLVPFAVAQISLNLF